MGSKRAASRHRPSLAVLPLALLATVIVVSQRKWDGGETRTQLEQPDQHLGAAFAKAAEQERAGAEQSGVASEMAAAGARVTAAVKDAAAAEVAAAAEASTAADEAAAEAAATQEAAAARAHAAYERAATAAEASDGGMATAAGGAKAAEAASAGVAVGAENAADAWVPAGAVVDSIAAAADGAAQAAVESADGEAGDSAALAAAGGEPEPSAEAELEQEAAALSAALESAAGETGAAGASGDSAAGIAAAASDAAAADAAQEAAGAAATISTTEASSQAAVGSQRAAAAKQQPCTESATAAPSPADALDSLLASTHEYFLSEEDVRRGVAFRGTGARAQAVAAKLLAGQPVHVAVVGGSVTWGQGAIHGGNFGVRFFNWVNATWPSPHHRFTNAAKPAVTSSLYAICGGSMVPKDADIIVLEFAFNDNYPGISLLSPPRASYEQLMRRMLNFPNSPLVMSMHFFGYWIAKPKLHGPDPPLFYATGEDDLAVIAQHYDVPVLSVRNAALHHMERGDPGFKIDIMDPHSTEGANLTDYFYYDDHHPYDLTGHRAMADLLVAVMQDAARSVVRKQAPQAQQERQRQQAQQVQSGRQVLEQPADQQQAQQLLQLADGQQQQQPAAQAEQPQQAQQAQQQADQQRQQQQAAQAEPQEEQAGQQPVQQAQHQLPPVPEPMFPGNWESPDPTCRLGASFKDVVLSSHGFEWRPQNPNATEVDAQKWAWQGHAPGDWVLLHLNTDLGRAAKKGDNARVILGHVRSWRDLGSARLECVAGCSCPTLRLEHQWKHKSTQTALVSFEVSQHPKCEIRVTVAKPAGPDAATILNAVMVDRAGGAGLEMGNVGQWDMMGNVGG